MAEMPSEPPIWRQANEAEENFRRRALIVSAVIVAAGAAAIALWLRLSAPGRAGDAPTAATPAAPAPATPAPTGPLNPLPANADATPLPPLAQADTPFFEALSGALGTGPARQNLLPDNLLRHVVASVDNLSRRRLAVELRPVRGPGGALRVSEQGGATYLSQDNYARYAPLVHALQAVDTGALAGVYRRFYPLLQEAYENLGYPGAYFNDRLVATIDDLLAAPEPEGPIELHQPKVFYEFADPDLERRSAGQKILIRMGPENARAVKGKLRELRTAIARRD